MASTPHRSLVLASISALALSGCPTSAPESAAPPEPPRPVEEPASPPPSPSFRLAPEAVTHAEDNERHWVELEVTVENPGSREIPVDLSQLVAKAGCLMPTPGWSLSTRPQSLGPGQKITGRAIWSCQPPIDPSAARPTSVRVRYFDSMGRQTFDQSVPVRVLGTVGVTASFGPPVSARPFVEPVPATGGGWDVCARGTARNGTEEPLVYVPRFKATTIEPDGAGGGAIGWLGARKTRLDPGETVDDEICFRFYGQDRPAPRRIRIEHVVAPAMPQELDVPPPS